MQKYNLILEKVTDYQIDGRATSPDKACTIARKVFNLDMQAEEVLVLLALSTKGDVIGAAEVSRGTINSSLCSPREILKRVITMNATSFIMLHNHPSGDTYPSKSDVTMTKQIQKASKILDIELQDHIIISEDDYTSLRAGGFM